MLAVNCVTRSDAAFAGAVMALKGAFEQVGVLSIARHLLDKALWQTKSGSFLSQLSLDTGVALCGRRRCFFVYDSF